MTETSIPTIHIITPSFNSGETIARTINSVMCQSGPFYIRYRIQDGGSTDDTVSIVEEYIRLISSNSVIQQCNGIDIDLVSRKDRGMYDAITNAVSDLCPSEYDWIGWINSDDTLAEGALAVLAAIDLNYNRDWIQWVTGDTSIREASTGLQISTYQRCHPREIIAQGLCDGLHWDFIQQEGTFFRKRLWDKCDIYNGFTVLKYAGDWNLWRMMSWKADLFKCAWPMGSFHRQEGQLSALKRHMYEIETVKIKNLDSRLSSLRAVEPEKLKYYIIDGDYKKRSIAVREQLASQKYTEWLERAKMTNKRANRSAAVHQYYSIDNYHYDHKLPVFAERTDILSCKEYWQYPAITERYAAEKAYQLLPESSTYQYLAFPWATLIDYINCNDPKRFLLYNILIRLANQCREDRITITTCQHVLAEKYKDLFAIANVSILFWSHATNSESRNRIASIHVKPFPLYPTQAAIYKLHRTALDISSTLQDQDRKLFSFRGALGAGYLTETRKIIRDSLSDSDLGDIQITSEWHFQKDVYGVQIDTDVKQRDSNESPLASLKSQLEDYLLSLYGSDFVLCPAGSGPNTIRLWECIELGLCPVVLSDTYMHPGSAQLWKEAVISIAESHQSIQAIPLTLSNELDKKDNRKHHINQVRLLYGTQVFINDILEEWISARSLRNPSSSRMKLLLASLQDSQAKFGVSEKRSLLIQRITEFINE